MLVSFTCCLFWSLEYGILVGALVQVVVILYHIARPKITARSEKVGIKNY